MGWFEIMDKMERDQNIAHRLDEKGGLFGIITDFLMPPPPNDYGGSQHSTGPSVTLFKISGTVLAALTCIWLFLYISTIAPYLGTYSYAYGGRVRGESGFGVHTMLLFKGQEAFMEYEVKRGSRNARPYTFDIQPWPAVIHSPDAVYVRGQAKGTLRVKIEKTGVYHFYSNAPYLVEADYTVTWGAR